MDKALSDLSENMIKLFYIFKSGSILSSSVSFESQSKLFVTTDDSVYCLGENSEGLLGLGHNNVVTEKTIIPQLSNKQIIEFHNGLNHCIARSIDGKLYSFGSNNLGYHTDNGLSNRPKMIESLENENVMQVSCGYYHTIVLTQNGQLFGWGDNRWGQIGINSKDKSVLIPNKILFGEKVESISCGSHHSMALTVSGKAWSWGWNRDGQLGVNSTADSLSPQMIDIFGKNVLFKKISCGLDHSLLLSTDGNIYSFGNNYNNQLGYEPKPDCKQLIPRMIETNPRIHFSNIWCLFKEDISTALSSTDGFCYIWGKCGEKVIKTVEKTEYKSCEQFFLNVFGITIKTELKLFYKSRSFEREFDKIEYLSEGGYGQVFKAVNKRNNKWYAIKRLDFTEQNANDEQLLQEIHFLSKLKSEYVVEYEDYWIESIKNKSKFIKNQYFLYIEMKLCLKTLKALNQQLIKELSRKESICESYIGFYIMSELMIEVIEGLNYLHRKGIIHRDLKPQNILITEFRNGRIVKIADFGISCIHEMTDDFKGISHTADVGDRRYMAPELLQWSHRESDKIFYDEKVDIYSLGIIFSQISSDIKLLEIKPIETLNTVSNIFKVKNKSLENITNKMISKDPEGRPNCQELLKNKENYFINLLDLNQSQEICEYLGIIEKNFIGETISKIFAFDYIEKKIFFALIKEKMPKKAILGLFSHLVNEQMVEFSSGFRHCIARTVGGKLYSFGNNYYKQLGYKTENEENNRPKLIESLNNENVIEVSCGNFHTIALTQVGQVFGWGGNDWGQVGVNSEHLFISNPIKIQGFNGEKIESISCGSLHSMALTVSGKVFSWGNNVWGQLGISSTNESRFPRIIQMFDKNVSFKRISCGRIHSLLLSMNGDIYSFGWKVCTQLGFDVPLYYNQFRETNNQQLIQPMIETNPKIHFSHISCHFLKDFSTALSSTDGFCYIWGKCGEKVIKSIEKTQYKSCEEFIDNLK